MKSLRCVLQVYANDLNPESAKYLALNVQLNSVSAQVLPFNMDGRQFVRLLLATPGGPVEQLPPPAADDAATAQQQQEQHVQQSQQQQQPLQQQQQDGAPVQAVAAADAGKKQQQQQQSKRKLVAEVPPAIPPGFRPPPGGLLFQHAVMNLPASAVEFLDAFNGAFDPASWAGRQLPLVHVYTFKKKETEAGEIRRLLHSCWHRQLGLYMQMQHLQQLRSCSGRYCVAPGGNDQSLHVWACACMQHKFQVSWHSENSAWTHAAPA
jgi:tRNA (guanine37-N1)-methyltransferase